MYARWLAALALVLAALPALAGCGDDAPPTEGIAKAADATAARGGAKVSFQQTFTVPGSGSISMSGRGVIDSRARTGRLTLSTSAPSEVASASEGSRFTQELIFDGFTIYIRSPQLAAVLPSGRRWLKIDLEKLGGKAGTDINMLTGTGQDPGQTVQLLKAVSGEVRKVADEDVRGVDTTHYRATVDLRKFPSTVPARNRAAAKRTIDRTIELTGTRTVPVDVWIDRDDLVRRVEQTLSIAVEGRSVPIRQRFELYDFGTSADVTPPPARQVQDVTDVAASGLSGAGGSRSAP